MTRPAPGRRGEQPLPRTATAYAACQQPPAVLRHERLLPAPSASSVPHGAAAWAQILPAKSRHLSGPQSHPGTQHQQQPLLTRRPGDLFQPGQRLRRRRRPLPRPRRQAHPGSQIPSAEPVHGRPDAAQRRAAQPEMPGVLPPTPPRRPHSRSCLVQEACHGPRVRASRSVSLVPAREAIRDLAVPPRRGQRVAPLQPQHVLQHLAPQLIRPWR
jgi:hypothetical protein